MAVTRTPARPFGIGSLVRVLRCPDRLGREGTVLAISGGLVVVHFGDTIRAYRKADLASVE